MYEVFTYLYYLIMIYVTCLDFKFDIEKRAVIFIKLEL